VLLPGDGELTTEDINTLLMASPTGFEPSTTDEPPVLEVVQRKMMKLGSVDRESGRGTERKEGLLSSDYGSNGGLGAQKDNFGGTNANPLASDLEGATASSDLI
jgi:hypothetical protein